MSRIVFFCREEREHLDIFEYYQQDIEALKALGHDVVVCTRYREIPLRFDAMFVWWWQYALWPVLLSRLLGRPCVITGVFNYRLPVDAVALVFAALSVDGLIRRGAVFTPPK